MKDDEMERAREIMRRYGLHRKTKDEQQQIVSAMLAFAQQPEGWRPIETAPKDGTQVDLWVEPQEAFLRHRIPNASWREPSDSEWWVHGGDTIETPDATWHDEFGPLGKDEQPTHWRPLPAPPAAMLDVAPIPGEE